MQLGGAVDERRLFNVRDVDSRADVYHQRIPAPEMRANDVIAARAIDTCISLDFTMSTSEWRWAPYLSGPTVLLGWSWSSVRAGPLS